MKIRYGLISGLVLCFLGSVAFGQAPASPAAGAMMGGGAVASAAAPAPAPVEGEMLPEEKFSNVRLDDFLDVVKQKVTGFNSVVVRGPGVSQDYPILPSMGMKNVTIGQFLEFVQTAFPGVGIKRIDGPAAPLYVITIRNEGSEAVLGAEADRGDGSMDMMVFPLDKIIDKLVYEAPGHTEDRKKALDDVLSLVEAAMKQQSGGAVPALQVHEATQTLVVRGTTAQLKGLSKVLGSLAPTSDDLNDIHNYQASKHESDSSAVLTAALEQANLNNKELNAQLGDLKRATTQPQK
jgi:hypothetical protein